MAGAGGLVPQAIVFALGAGALGGADALRLLLQFAGRISPAVDVAICVVVISLLTAPLLGTMLLARFVRKAGPGAGGGAAPAATDLFAHMTATFSVGAAFLVTACLLLAVPGGGLGAAIRLPFDFAVKNPVVVTVLTICAAFAAAAVALRARSFFRGAGSAGFLVTACLLLAVPGGGLGAAIRLPFDFAVKNPVVVTMLTICAAFAAAAVALRARSFFRGAGSAGGPAPDAPPATTIKVMVFVVAVLFLVASFAASDGFDANAHAHWRRGMVTLPVGVAIVTVAGTTTLLVWFSRRARNAAGAGAGAAARTS